ncbi:MAG: DbpA RNA binding domain-containing protein [Treponema sp.]|nr:DbpA RNA binding domain-containing protein [Treponema sp.]
MAYYRETEIDFEQVGNFLKEALSKVMLEENPDVLNDLKKIYKKTIPFSKRMYVAAYLVKEAQWRYRGHKRFSKSFSPSSRIDHGRIPRRSYEHNGQEQERESRPRTQIDPSVSSTIFLSIGRNRRVYPRDLVGILINVAGIERERIGDIRVLSNYSFVQLFKDDADKVINTLNGYDYRGRKLTVSYSNQRVEEMDAEISEDAKAYAAAEKASFDKEPFSSPSSSENRSFGM